MTTHFTRSYSVAISAEKVQRMKRVCKEVSLAQTKLASIAIDKFVKDPNVAQQLMEGYVEMARLNREITSEFTCCEEDAETVLTRARAKIL